MDLGVELRMWICEALVEVCFDVCVSGEAVQADREVVEDAVCVGHY